MRFIALFLAFIAAIFFNFNGDYYEGKWLGLGLCFVLIIGHYTAKKLGLMVAIFLSYLISSNLWLCLYGNTSYATAQPDQLMALKEYSLEAALKLLLLVLPVLILDVKEQSFRIFGRALAICFLFMSLGIIFWEAYWFGCQNVNACGGTLMNPSLNAGAIICVLPLVVGPLRARYAVPIIGLVAFGVVLGQSGVGLALLGLFIILHNWRITPIFAIMIFARRFLYNHKTILSLGDRDVMWRFFLEKWLHNHQFLHRFFGLGFGTFDMFSRLMQGHFQMRAQYWWKWPHNDFLELLITNGFLGLTLGVIVLLLAGKGLYKKGYIQEAKSLIIFSAMMFCNYPLRVGLTCALGLFLTYLGLLKRGVYT